MQGCKKTYKIHIKHQSTTHIYILIVVILVGHEIKKIFDFRFSNFRRKFPTDFRFSFFDKLESVSIFDFRKCLSGFSSNPEMEYYFFIFALIFFIFSSPFLVVLLFLFCRLGFVNWCLKCTELPFLPHLQAKGKS